MQCKHCSYPESSVVYTKHNDAKQLTERRRECLRCGGRFTTHEKIREAYLQHKTVPPTHILPK